MKRIVSSILLVFIFFTGLEAQDINIPSVKSKCVLEGNRLKSVVNNITDNTELIEEVNSVSASEELCEIPVSVNEYNNETQFRIAYDKILNEYLNEYASANKKFVEANATIDNAAALSFEKIQETNFSDAWSQTEIEYKKQQLCDNLTSEVESLREVTINRIQKEYNAKIAQLDMMKTELDAALMSTEFVINNVDIIFSPYDNISKCWQVKVTSFDPEVRFETSWLKIKLEYEALEQEYENIAPKIKNGEIRGQAHYVVNISKKNEDPEALSFYEKVITKIELLDKEGKRVVIFDNLNIPAGNWTWDSYKKLVSVDSSVALNGK